MRGMLTQDSEDIDNSYTRIANNFKECSMNDSRIFECKFKDRSIKLYNMDCIEGMKEHLPDRSVDVVVTSPPYNIGVDYGEYDDNGPREQYLDWLEKVALEIKRVLKDEGSFFLNLGSKPSDPWVPFEVASKMRYIFQLQNTIHWIKSIAIEKKDVGDYPGITDDIAVGHYKPINSDRFLHNGHEFIFHFTKSGDVKLDKLAIGVKYQDKSNIGRWKSAGDDKRCRGNTWFIPYKTIRNGSLERPHPASFPVELAEMCIRLHGLEKTELVLDPFNGIGNATMACFNIGIDGISFEIDKNYFEESVRILKKKLKKPKK